MHIMNVLIHVITQAKSINGSAGDSKTLLLGYPRNACYVA